MISFETADRILADLGCDYITKEKSPKLMVFRINTTENRTILLDRIQEKIEHLGFDFKRTKISSYSSVGHLKSGECVFVVKPLSGPTENLHLKNGCLMEGGKLEYVDLFGQENVECRTFLSYEQLAESILMGMIKNESNEKKICVYYLKRTN